MSTSNVVASKYLLVITPWNVKRATCRKPWYLDSHHKYLKCMQGPVVVSINQPDFICIVTVWLDKTTVVVAES